MMQHVTATLHPQRFPFLLRLAALFLFGLLLFIPEAYAQPRNVKVGDAPAPTGAPQVQWVNGYSPDNGAQPTFYFIEPTGAQRAYSSDFQSLTWDAPKPLDLFPGSAPAHMLTTAPGLLSPPPASMAPVPVSGFETQDFDDNGTVTGGFRYIPSDTHGAAGPSDIIVVNNVSIASYDKTTGAVSGVAFQSLKTFFGSATATFDPKAVYDNFDGRFVVVTLEKETSPSNASRVLIAASPVGTPAGVWTAISIDTKLTISATESWCDYPGIAVDEEAIYVTCNYFSFPGSFMGERLLVIDKASLYAGTFSAGTDLSIYDPATAVGLSATTMMPARVHSDPGGTIGTWLVAYSGISGGGTEYVQVIRVNTPLAGAATFSGSYISMGDQDDTSTGTIPDMAQSGTATLVESNDRRALDAVWRNDRLWAVMTMVPGSGDDAGQSTAHFVQLNTVPATPTVVNQGHVGGEEIGVGTYTTFPSISVNDTCAMMGFSASNSSIYPGAYYVGIDPATASTGLAQTMRAGDDYYIRTFGGSRNRWGDYSATVLDYSDSSFWVINKYAQTRGTLISGEDGRWGTYVQNEACDGLLPVELEGFGAVVDGASILLSWKTMSETNNAGFDVQHRSGIDVSNAFESLGFMKGAGTTTEVQSYNHPVTGVGAGRHFFRLKQVDFDGTFVYSPEIEVFVDLPGAYLLSEAYPNPFNPQTSFTLMVQVEQRVRVAVYDLLGRQVALLHEGTLTANEVHNFTFDAARLPSGVYLYRVAGETFGTARTMLLMK